MRPAIAALTLLFAAVSACATGSAPSTTPSYNVQGAYDGRFTLDGQRFDATLRLSPSAPGRVEGALRVAEPTTIEGSASGVIIDELLRLTVEYPGPNGCDGTIEGILTIEPGGGVFTGPVTVTDCRGPVGGQMSFRRIERRPG